MLTKLTAFIALSVTSLPVFGTDCSNWASIEFFENASAKDVRTCIENGKDVKEEGEEDGGTAILWAAHKSKDSEIIQVLLSAGADVNATDVTRSTPLNIAAGFNQNPNIITTLVMGGAKLDAYDFGGMTPIHRAAAWNENPEVIKALISAGANINLPGYYDRTPLHMAAASNKNPEVLEAMITYGADIAALDAFGTLPYEEAQNNPALKHTAVYDKLRAVKP